MPTDETRGADIVSRGGMGGAGSAAGSPFRFDTTGGAGGVGGAGGNTSVQFNATFVPDPATGLLADIGLICIVVWRSWRNRRGYG